MCDAPGNLIVRDLDAPYVFVDPGVHFSGVAWLTRRQLCAAEYRPAAEPLPRYDSTVCVCERPKVYDEETQARMGRRIKSKDIEDLLIAAGRMTGNIPTEYLYAVQWKGTARKDPMHRRAMGTATRRGILSEVERTIIECALTNVPVAEHHNVYDAVCMGLKYLGRWR